MIEASRIKILDFVIGNYSQELIIQCISDAIESRSPISIACVNSHYISFANKNSHVKKILDSIDILHADGIGVYFASKILYGNKGLHEKLTGTDLYYSILKRAAQEKWKIFLLGNTDDVVRNASQRTTLLFPGLQIVGFHHGYFDLSDSTILQKINTSHADIVFISLGMPKQELWLEQYQDTLLVPVRILSGSGILHMSGLLWRAPVLVQYIGLEWLFRLLQEPKRLWRRYLIGNPMFMYRILRRRFIKTLE